MEVITLTDIYDPTAPFSNETLPGSENLTTITTVGPHFARQIMRFNNQTVVSKVPEEMLHLIDTYW